MKPPIKVYDVGAGYRREMTEINAAIEKVLLSGRYILDEQVAAFEEEFATWLGTRYAIACASGTDALVLSMLSQGIGPGCAVVTPSYGPIAVIAAIEAAGAQPLLVDVDPNTYTIDPEDFSAALTNPPSGSATIKAVVAVHLYGQPADLDRIAEIASQTGVALIEDCSQAHGAEYKGKKVGTYSSVSTFSFYPTKNLGGLGDAGLVATSSRIIASKIRRLRQYGWDKKRCSHYPGINSRMDELQAAVLRIRLTSLDGKNDRRRAIADQYYNAVIDPRITLPARRELCQPVFHQFIIRTEERDVFSKVLLANGIETRVHYPRPIHLEPAYSGRIGTGPSRCRVSELVSEQALAVPIYPELTNHQVTRVAQAMQQASRRAG